MDGEKNENTGIVYPLVAWLVIPLYRRGNYLPGISPDIAAVLLLGLVSMVDRQRAVVDSRYGS